jgi:polar amino acid transport system substrate-binding protein
VRTSTILLCVLLAAGIAPAGTLDEIRSRGTLRWGGDPSGGAPYVYADPAEPNRYIGFDVEVAELIAREIGVKPEFAAADWESLLPSLNRREFDVIIDGFEPTPDRKREILFSVPYYIFRQQLTARSSDTSIVDLVSCRGKRVGTLVNTAASRFLASMGFTASEYDNPVAAYSDLELNRIDAVLLDRPIAVFYAHPNPALRDAGKPFQEGLYSVGIRRGDDSLRMAIDAAINRLIDNGSLRRVFEKWQMWDPEQIHIKDFEAIDQKQVDVKFNWSDGFNKLLAAALVTIGIAVLAMAVAIALGLVLAIVEMLGPAWLRAIVIAYIEVFRGTPVLVQLLFLYFGLPVIGITMPNWLTAIIGLGLNYAAYESQVYRGAFEAVPHGQHEAAEVLGMTRSLALRRIILPQTFRIALPSMTNDFISLFKDTSTAFAISVWELATAYRELANASQKFLLLGAVTALIYFAMSYPLSLLARRLEHWLRPLESR